MTHETLTVSGDRRDWPAPDPDERVDLPKPLWRRITRKD